MFFFHWKIYRIRYYPSLQEIILVGLIDFKRFFWASSIWIRIFFFFGNARCGFENNENGAGLDFSPRKRHIRYSCKVFHLGKKFLRDNNFYLIQDKSKDCPWRFRFLSISQAYIRFIFTADTIVYSVLMHSIPRTNVLIYRQKNQTKFSIGTSFLVLKICCSKKILPRFVRTVWGIVFQSCAQGSEGKTLHFIGRQLRS